MTRQGGEPRVAVIIPAYQPGPLLGRSLASVREQTWQDWEAVVVDDGSTEDLSWVDRMDTRIRRVRQPNRGVSVARNHGLRVTRAPLVAWLDQDDEWYPGKLEAQLTALDERPDVGLCDTDVDIVRADGSVLEESFDHHGGDALGLLAGATICLSSAVARRDAVVDAGGFDPRLRLFQDIDLFLRIGVAGWSFHRVEERLTRYYLHGANASRDYVSGWREVEASLNLQAQQAASRGDRATVEAARRGLQVRRMTYGAQAFDVFRERAREHDLPGAVPHLVRAVRWSPAYVSRSLGSWALSRARPHR